MVLKNGPELLSCLTSLLASLARVRQILGPSRKARVPTCMGATNLVGGGGGIHPGHEQGHDETHEDDLDDDSKSIFRRIGCVDD